MGGKNENNRHGRITRYRALEYVKKYDGKYSEKYTKKFYGYIKISIDEFWAITDKFRGEMWIKNTGGKWHNVYWNALY